MLMWMQKVQLAAVDVFSGGEWKYVAVDCWLCAAYISSWCMECAQFMLL